MVNVHKIKQEICEIGRRIYKKGFAAANDGNISVRISENEVLCTPTMHCKGFMKPDDICMVDMAGQPDRRQQEAIERSPAAPGDLQAAGRGQVRSSTAIRRTPRRSASPASRFRSACCPRSRSSWATCRSRSTRPPAARTFADTILPFVNKTNIIILANHGTVSYGETVEQAYWWTEILDAYCRMLMLARRSGRSRLLHGSEGTRAAGTQEQWGYADPRNTRSTRTATFAPTTSSATAGGSGGQPQGVRPAARRWAPKRNKPAARGLVRPGGTDSGHHQPRDRGPCQTVSPLENRQPAGGRVDPNVAEKLRRTALPGRPVTHENATDMMILDFTNGEFRKPPKPLRFVPQTTARKGRRTFRILQLWRRVFETHRTTADLRDVIASAWKG